MESNNVSIQEAYDNLRNTHYNEYVSLLADVIEEYAISIGGYDKIVQDHLSKMRDGKIKEILHSGVKIWEKRPRIDAKKHIYNICVRASGIRTDGYSAIVLADIKKHKTYDDILDVCELRTAGSATYYLCQDKALLERAIVSWMAQ